VSVYNDMANDAGYPFGTDENEQMAALIQSNEMEEYHRAMEEQERREIISKAFDEVLMELGRATKKFGPMASPHEGYAVIKEELDELWDEIKKKISIVNTEDERRTKMRKEAIQVAAMGLRFIIDLGGAE